MKRIRTFAKILVFMAVISCTSVYKPSSALACMGPCPNSITSNVSWGQYFSDLKSNVQQYYNDVQVFMTRVASVQQAIQFAQEFYYFMKSLQYMNSATGVTGAIMNVSNAANGFMGMASQGLQAYNGLAQYTFGSVNGQGQFQANGYTFDPATMQSLQNGMGVISGGLSSIAGASSSLGLLAQQNAGNNFLGAANGAQLTTQAVLQVGQGISGILSYQVQKDQQKQNQKTLDAMELQREKLESTPQLQLIPCRDMPIYLKAYVVGVPPQTSYNCATMTMPQPYTPMDPATYQVRVQIAQQMQQQALMQKSQLASNPKTAQIASLIQIPSLPQQPTPPIPVTGTVPNYPPAVPVPTFTGGISSLTGGP